MMNTECYGEYVEHREIENKQSETIVKKPRHLTRRASEVIFIIAMLLLPIIQFVVFWIIPNFKEKIQLEAAGSEINGGQPLL